MHQLLQYLSELLQEGSDQLRFWHLQIAPNICSEPPATLSFEDVELLYLEKVLFNIRKTLILTINTLSFCFDIAQQYPSSVWRMSLKGLYAM